MGHQSFRSDASTPCVRILAFACVVAAPLLFSSCKKDAEKADEAAPKIDGNKITMAADAPQKSSLAVEVAKPLAKSVTRLTGRLIWDEDATVRVFAPVAGRVENIVATWNDRVNTGDTLATFYSPDFGQAQADASRAVSGLKLAERTLARVRELHAHGAAPKKDVEAAEDDLEGKRSENERAQARLQLYGAKLGVVNGMFPLKAPLAGVIVEKNINPGQEVRPDQMLANDAKLVLPLFVISSPARLSVMLDATELDIAGLRPGQPLQIHTRAFPGRSFVGKLAYIGDSLDPVTRTVKARGVVENPDGLLKAEMFVAVDVATDGADRIAAQSETAVSGDIPRARPLAAAVEIPSKAVFLKDNQHFIFIEKTPGNYERQSVEVGLEHEGRVSITGGLVAGQRVVTDGSLLLQTMTETGKP